MNCLIYTAGDVLNYSEINYVYQNKTMRPFFSA